MNEEYKEAINIGSVTLVGYGRSVYPLSKGNCFSVGTNDRNQWYKIVNFCYENLQYLIKEKIVSFPIKILEIGKYIAVICDNRIPREFYSNKFCTVCTPSSLLPIPQRLEQLLDIQDGIRKEYGNGIIEYNCEKGNNVRKLRTKWTVKTDPDIDCFTSDDGKMSLESYILCPYVPLTKDENNES